MLTPENCDLFNRPFFQFAQMKQYQPEAIAPTKAAYKSAWQTWRALVLQVADELCAPFAPPHIERWCNGWQVRAHFFAFFKYAEHQDSAPILSLLLNRRRLCISLDWHAYKAKQSASTLAQYRQWPQALTAAQYAGFEMWRDSDGEYADYPDVAAQLARGTDLAGDDFFCIGKNIERDDLASVNSLHEITQTIRALQPLYEACFE
ncbi:MAG: HI_0552 family protein [Neisseria sp.]|nr:HI_0552 family protein [Neisseria sp.]